MKLTNITVEKNNLRFILNFDFDGYMFSVEIRKGSSFSIVARMLDRIVKELRKQS